MFKISGGKSWVSATAAHSLSTVSPIIGYNVCVVGKTCCRACQVSVSSECYVNQNGKESVLVDTYKAAYDMITAAMTP